MADEMRLNYRPGRTVTARVVDESGLYWHVVNEEFEVFGTYTDYDISMAAKGGGTYRGDFPDCDAGVYSILYHDSTAPTNPFGQQTPFVWDGEQEVSIADAVLQGALWDSSISAPGGGITEICNMALARIGMVAGGDLTYIKDINDVDDPTAMWCSRLWSMTRNFVMADWDWPELLRYDELPAEVAEASQYNFPGDPTYVYQLPDNTLAMRGLVDKNVLDDYDDEIPLPYNRTGNQYACEFDENSALVKYILLVSDTTQWSDALKDAVAARLAFVLAKPMGLNDQGRSQLLVEYKDAIYAAKGQVQLTVKDPDQDGTELITDIT